MTYNLSEMQSEALALVNSNSLPAVNTHEDFAKAGDYLKMAKNKIKQLDEKRKTYTDPLLKQQKLIKADFDKVAEPYVKFVEELELKMKAFWAQEKLRVDQLQLELDTKAASTAGVDGALVEIVNDLKTTRGDLASTSVRTVTKWKLTDINAVPTKFLMVDDKALNEHIKNGGACPSGISYYEDLVLSSR